MSQKTRQLSNRPPDFFWPDANGDLQPYIATGVERDIIDAIGVDLAGALFLQFGGTPLYLSGRDHGGELRSVLGVESVDKLAQHFGPGFIPRLPLGNEFLIKLFASKNWSKLNIARVVRASDETVRRMLWAPAKRKAVLEVQLNAAFKKLRGANK